jgi:hypothetical protein
MMAILLRLARLELGRDTDLDPPDGELGQIAQAVEAEGCPLSERMRSGRPWSRKRVLEASAGPGDVRSFHRRALESGSGRPVRSADSRGLPSAGRHETGGSLILVAAFLGIESLRTQGSFRCRVTVNDQPVMKCKGSTQNVPTGCLYNEGEILVALCNEGEILVALCRDKILC